MFLKLIEHPTPGRDPKPILINTNHIISVQPAFEGCVLHVASGSPRIEVIESFDVVTQILSEMGDL